MSFLQVDELFDTEGSPLNLSPNTVTTSTAPDQPLAEALDERVIVTATRAAMRAITTANTGQQFSPADGGLFEFDGSAFVPKFSETLTVSIPTDYPSYQAAIDDLSNFTPAQGVLIDLVGEPGFMPTSGIRVDNGYYGHFRISHADAEVFFIGGAGSRFIEAINAYAPILNCYVNGQGTADRCYAITNGFGVVNASCGGTDFAGRILYTLNAGLVGGGSIWKNFTDQIYCSRGSGWALGNALIEGGRVAGNGCVTISRGGRCDAQGITIRDCIPGVEVKRAGSSFNAHEATIEDVGGFVVRCQRAANCSLDESTITGVLDDGLEIFSGSSMSFQDGTITAAPGNSGTGVKCYDSKISGNAGTTVTGFGLDGVECRGASSVGFEASTISNSGRHGAYSDKGGSITIVDGSVTGSGGDDLRIERGSFITAKGCSTTNGVGSPDVNDTNVAGVGGFNNIAASGRGIIWT